VHTQIFPSAHNFSKPGILNYVHACDGPMHQCTLLKNPLRHQKHFEHHSKHVQGQKQCLYSFNNALKTLLKTIFSKK
jgi:hypothetical protein